MTARRHAPATARNREGIAAVLRDELPTAGLVLEVASGTGEHAAYLAGLFPALEWQPSDPDAMARESISAWREEGALPNLRAPVALDAAAEHWPLDHAEAILCVNMVHISPWEATLGLLDGAGRILPPGGPLVLYGPYFRDAVETAPSNIAFDIDLRNRNPAWGLRHLEAVDRAARARGLEPMRLVDMPANNIIRAYRRV
ncbi:class I SAM-dependent methyltransferase [Sphingobium sufflavum]|uniref:DUF938 domain-containing protein n=1 Tax=Sphingobium sufflavum TaxID=1129547 RepID=UPI001F16EA49|nr:DUF938 domain-containing protein [Sphingobium sufflavum]MCE7795890.1 class I SAM-dependent methyltransferase [Sphingobium sufflavum]